MTGHDILLGISVLRQKGSQIMIGDPHRPPEPMGHEIAGVDPPVHCPRRNIQMLGDALDLPEGLGLGFRRARHGHGSRRLGGGVRGPGSVAILVARRRGLQNLRLCNDVTRRLPGEQPGQCPESGVGLWPLSSLVVSRDRTLAHPASMGQRRAGILWRINDGALL